MPLSLAARLVLLLLVPILAGCVPSLASFDAPGQLPPGATPDFAEAVDRIGPVATEMCRAAPQRRNCAFAFAVDDREGLPANAFQTLDRRGRPWIVVTSALIALARNPDELAFVIGHEAAHHVAGHIPKREMQAVEGAMLAGVLATAAGATPEEVEEAQSLGAALAAGQYSQRFELEADALGAEIAWRAGFDPLRGAAFLSRLPDPGAQGHRSHPSNAERRKVVARSVAALEAAAP